MMKVALIDDHSLVRAGLEALVGGHIGWQVSWSGDNVADYLATGITSDVVVLDIDLNGHAADSSDVAALIRSGSAVLIVSALASPSAVKELARAGAAGFVSKADSADTLPQAIATVGAGGHWLPPATMQLLLEADGEADPGLTAAERRVLELFSSGMTVTTIARLLDVSPATVHVHLKRIRTKFAAIDRPASGPVDLYKRAVEFGITPVPGQPGPTPTGGDR